MLAFFFLFFCQLYFFSAEARSAEATCQKNDGNCEMWTRADSDRWPPHCKCDALPAELRAQMWACQDSNLGPFHYQWNALTSWATRPYFRILAKNCKNVYIIAAFGRNIKINFCISPSFAIIKSLSKAFYLYNFGFLELSRLRVIDI